MAAYRWVGNGCPPKCRLALCQAFIAKAVWHFPTTRGLIEAILHRPVLRRLCGWETLGAVPSEATFSRAFAAFAQDALPQRIQEAMIKAHYGDKMAGHVSRDATAIHARERAARKPSPPPEAPKKRGRHRKGEPSPPPQPTRLEQQLERRLENNIADLPMACDWGTKKDSNGKKQTWRGYKLHIDVVDGDLPVSWLVTAASLHDSQAAIPLAQMTAARVISLHDLADAAYDATAIREMSARLDLGELRVVPEVSQPSHLAAADDADLHSIHLPAPDIPEQRGVGRGAHRGRGHWGTVSAGARVTTPH
jgi:hypothetical protein